MRTKLDILPMQSAMPQHAASAFESVQLKQQKMKHYTDAKRGTRPPLSKPGESVRVRNPHHVPKAHPRFTPPLTVEKRIGRNSFLLSDGKIWNASHLAHFPSGTKQDCNTPRQSSIGTTPSLKTQRVKYKPKWHKDYVMP